MGIIKTLTSSPEGASGKSRLQTLDLLRGLTLVSMILYHGMWDVLYLSESGASMEGARSWYEGSGGFWWQQSICWTFILLSGFCVPLSRRIIRRGIQVSLCGLAVTAVTFLGMYDQRVFCGVLSFLGAAMLLTGALRTICKKTRYSLPGLAVCAYLFYMTRWINRGRIRLWPGREAAVPPFLYGSASTGLPGMLLAALGFPGKDFFSTDYFSLIPWIFLFWAGVFLHGLLRSESSLSRRSRGEFSEEDRPESGFSHPAMHLHVPLLNAMGEHSLLVYLLHQPVLYLLARIFF